MIYTCGSDDGWNDHRWSGLRPRRLYIEGNGPVLHQHCFRCGRDFIRDQSSARRFAVFVSAISFHQLDRRVTARWLRERCSGERLPSDDADRKERIAEFFVSEDDRTHLDSRRVA